MVLTVENTRNILNHHVCVFKRHARFHKLPDCSNKPIHALSQLVSPVIGEQAIGDNEPTFLVAFDVVGPFEEPAPKLFWRLSLHFVACLRGRHDYNDDNPHAQVRPRAGPPACSDVSGGVNIIIFARFSGQQVNVVGTQP